MVSEINSNAATRSEEFPGRPASFVDSANMLLYEECYPAHCSFTACESRIANPKMHKRTVPPETSCSDTAAAESTSNTIHQFRDSLWRKRRKAGK